MAQGRTKSIIRNSVSRFSAAFAWLHVCDGWKFLSSLFILSTVHLTLKRTNHSLPLRLSDSRSISRSHSCCVSLLSSRFFVYSVVYFFRIKSRYFFVFIIIILPIDLFSSLYHICCIYVICSRFVSKLSSYVCAKNCCFIICMKRISNITRKN